MQKWAEKNASETLSRYGNNADIMTPADIHTNDIEAKPCRCENNYLYNNVLIINIKLEQGHSITNWTLQKLA